MKRCSLVLLGVLLLAVGWAGGAHAQGVTTSALGGTVTGAEGQPLAGVQITARNVATGDVRTVVTNAEGRYFLGNLLPGGPYTVSASRVGFGTQERRDVTLVLSQTSTVSFRLAEAALLLEAVTVAAEANPVISRSRTGAGTVIGEATVEAVPTINRNFTEIAVVSPYVTATGDAPSVGGANNRYNNIQIDGATTSDIFGLGSSGTPGGQGTPAKPVPLDAIEQFQVLVSPFDVRQTGFTGGLINAVTKSGTNQFRGSAFGTFRNESLVRGDTLRGYGRNFAPPRDFLTQQYGFTLGGPVIRDRMHFFVAAEVEESQRPGLFSINDPANVINVRSAKVDSVLAAGAAQGLNLGSPGTLDEESRLGSFLGRLDFRINDAHRLVLRHNSTPKWRDDAGISRGGTTFDLTSYNFYYRTTNNSTVGQLFSQFGTNLSNELLANFQTIRDRPTPEVRMSTLEITAVDTIGGRSVNARIRAGSEISRHANELDQDIYQVTNNLTWTTGAHRLTLGLNVEGYSFRNLFLQGALGTYFFASPTAFANRQPNRYTANVPLREDINARFGVTQPGVYLQNVWTASEALQITAGVRVDVPYMNDRPERNDMFVASFNRDNSAVPSGNALWSPRVGFNLQLGEGQVTQLRGGVGIFSGRPPFVWLSNVYGNTGRDFVSINCTGANVPAYDPLNPPSACATAGGVTAAQMMVNYVDPDFRFPQDMKATLGVDRELPFGFTGTAEVVFTRGVNTLITREVNLAGPRTDIPATAMQGLGPREIYGRPTTGNRIAFEPVRLDSAFRHVVELTNGGRSEQMLVVTELARRFGRNMNASAAYTFQRSRDPISLTSSVATSNHGFHPIGARTNDFSTAPSAFERPHKLTFVASLRDLFPRFGGTEVSAIYIGQSGRTYNYVYDGDLNGDGYESLASGMGGRNNDLVYVPNDLDEIVWRTPADRQLFQELIDQEPCLQQARGTIMTRNACRGPWTNQMDVRLSQNIPTGQFGRLALDVNIFNFLNLMNREWGLQQGPQFNTINLLDYDGRVGNNVNGAPVFRYAGFTSTRTVDGNQVRNAELPYTTFFGSRYQVQMGLRYRF